jgi:hypothetical protein
MIGVHISMSAVLVAMVASNVVNYLTNGIIAQRYIKYSLSRQLLDVAPIFATATILGSMVYYIALVWNINWIVLVVLYSALYLVASHAMGIKAMSEAIRVIRRGINRDM